MKKIIPVLLISLVIILCGYLFFSKDRQNREEASALGQERLDSTKEINFTASFEIYTYGTKRIFTEAKYHNQSQDVYIEGSDPSVIFVKKEGVTWDDFFQTLPMSLSKDCLVTGTQQAFCTGESGILEFVLNGQVDPDALQKEIRQGDNLQVNYGG